MEVAAKMIRFLVLMDEYSGMSCLCVVSCDVLLVPPLLTPILILIRMNTLNKLVLRIIIMLVVMLVLLYVNNLQYYV